MPRHNRHTNHKKISKSTWHRTLKKLRADLIVKPEQKNAENEESAKNRELFPVFFNKKIITRLSNHQIII